MICWKEGKSQIALTSPFDLYDKTMFYKQMINIINQAENTKSLRDITAANAKMGEIPYILTT